MGTPRLGPGRNQMITLLNLLAQCIKKRESQNKVLITLSDCQPSICRSRICSFPGCSVADALYIWHPITGNSCSWTASAVHSVPENDSMPVDLARGHDPNLRPKMTLSQANPTGHPTDLGTRQPTNQLHHCAVSCRLWSYKDSA